MKKSSSNTLLWVIYAVFFFYNLHLALGLYINSSFLSQGCQCGIPENMVGLLFALGSLGGITTTLFMGKIGKLLGSLKRVFVISIIGTLLALLGFIFIKSAPLVGFLFVVYWSISYAFAFVSDIFVESYSEDSTTGGTRGVFLTIAGLGMMLAPLVAGKLLESPNGFTLLYSLGGTLSIISLTILLTLGKKIKEPTRRETHILKGFKNFIKKKTHTSAFGINFLLQLFFSWMIIYTPIYLNKIIGLDWVQIGAIFTVMLAPFVLIEIPLGRLADKILGEKEILYTGVIIMIISTVGVGLFSGNSLGLWMLLLVLTRIGASAVQVASETYFFKQVDETDIEDISIFRLTSPLAFVVGPILGTILLSLFGFELNWLYFVLAGILFLSFPLIYRMKDTL